MRRKKHVLSEAEINRLEELRIETDYAVEIDNLEVHYQTDRAVVRAVNGIELKVSKKSIMGIVGETGAGKTTAMLSLMCLIPSPPGVIKNGRIMVNGIDMRALSAKELAAVRGKEISMIFQDPMTSLNPVMTVGQQIAESIILHEAVSDAQAMEKAKDLLKTVGIAPERYGEYPHQFSGGMRQRVGIAIALACRPAVLIADEPTTALDVTIQAQVLQLMRELKEQYDTSLLLITHDLGVVAEMCDEVAVMYAGKIVEKGSVEDIFERMKHPYTEGLFNSLPNIRNKVSMLKPIDGQIPDPADLPEGCSFAPRCPYAMARCHEEQPAARVVSGIHMVECLAYDIPGFSLKGEC